MSEERLSRGKFIRLGAALGVGAASASVLASCGGGSGGNGGEQAEDPGDQPRGKTAETAEGGMTAAPSGTAITEESKVAPGSGVPFDDAESGGPAVLVHLENGDFVAYSAVCTHQGCTVAYKDGKLACPCHGSVFDPANGGAVVSPPANRPLPDIPVEVRDGKVFRA